MAQTALGACRVNAARLGMDLSDYLNRNVSNKWCTGCKTWHSRMEFGVDRTRSDGLASSCIASRASGHPRGWHGRPIANPITGRPGPVPHPCRDGDKRQAREKVNLEVYWKRLPHPRALPCTDCGHVWQPGERRHEYDHFLGYAAEHHYDVQVVCTTCHHRRSVERGEIRPRTRCRPVTFTKGGGLDG